MVSPPSGSANDDHALHEGMRRAVIGVGAGLLEAVLPGGARLDEPRVEGPVIGRYRMRERITIDPLDGRAGRHFDPRVLECELPYIDAHDAVWPRLHALHGAPLRAAPRVAAQRDGDRVLEADARAIAAARESLQGPGADVRHVQQPESPDPARHGEAEIRAARRHVVAPLERGVEGRTGGLAQWRDPAEELPLVRERAHEIGVRAVGEARRGPRRYAERDEERGCVVQFAHRRWAHVEAMDQIELYDPGRRHPRAGQVRWRVEGGLRRGGAGPQERERHDERAHP